MDDARLTAAIVWLAERMSVTQDPWWILGGASIALMSCDSASIMDIDVLVSDRDGQRLSDQFDWRNHADGRSNKFQSTWFLKTSFQDLPIELMSSLRVKSGEHWRQVHLQTRRALKVANAFVFLPEPSELADLFELFGRRKDLERAALLRQMLE